MAFLRHTHLFGHEASAPVRAVGWHGFQSLANDASICWSVILRGAPTGGSSSKPSIPNSRNRSRHFPTVAPVMCSFRATSELLIPCPQLSTIRARIAMACDDFGLRAIMLNFSRSASTISSDFLGRPVACPSMRPKPELCSYFSLGTLGFAGIMLPPPRSPICSRTNARLYRYPMVMGQVILFSGH